MVKAITTSDHNRPDIIMHVRHRPTEPVTGNLTSSADDVKYFDVSYSMRPDEINQKNCSLS